MSTPRRPYARLPQGCIDDALKAGVSKHAALVLALVRTHRAKRSIPGLLCFGPSGLAESLSGGFTAADVKRAIAELVKHRQLLTDFDARPPLLYVIGAVKADPPTTANATRGMAIQYAELPASPVKAHVHQEVSDALAGSEWLSKWMEWTGPGSTPDSGPDPRPESGPEPGPLQDPIPIPRSAAAAAADPQPAAVAAYRLAWSRLPSPAFAAAADADIERAIRAWPPGTFATLLECLALSRWVTGAGGLTSPPTLRRLLEKPQLATDIVSGNYGPVKGWRCPSCGSPHAITAECPPKRPCGRWHSDAEFCRHCRQVDGGAPTPAPMPDLRAAVRRSGLKRVDDGAAVAVRGATSVAGPLARPVSERVDGAQDSRSSQGAAMGGGDVG